MGNVADDGLDQIETERLLWRLVDAGLVAVHQRRNRLGEWESYQWTTTEKGEQFVDNAADRDEVDPSEYLEAATEEERHPILVRIRKALESSLPESSPIMARLLMALGRQIRRGRRPTDRELSLAAVGDTKGLDLEHRRDELESILGCPLEDVVYFRGREVRAWGNFAFDIRGQRVTGDWSIPWLSVTEQTLA